MNEPSYPTSPATVDPRKLDISPAFRRQVPRVIGAILLFTLVYLLLVVAAAALAIACGWFGVSLIIRVGGILALIVGAGIIAVGVSVFVFLVKFVFAVARDERSDRIQITESEQPRLFAFIRQLARETRTPFPKKIFLSPSVNACVFYNSSFWSMFLPVRKNLEIGLGLVNSVNLSEFKAVIAHEFGHFSQRSMRLGSFTYNVNRVIYNMLYENNDYTAFLQAWAGIHRLLRYFASVTVRIARGIQWVLRRMYQVINRTYMGLSREMEFHADTVAAAVSGSNNSISALARIEVASSCFNAAVNDANAQLQNKKITFNIYPNQLIVMRTIAAEYQLPVRGGLPEFSFHFIESFSHSRINYKDQWASHPTLKERKANLDRLDIPAPPDDASAWELFDQPETWQRKLTGQLYRALTLDAPVHYDAAEFEARFQKERAAHQLPAVFQHFYDNRYIDLASWDLDHLAAAPAPEMTAAEIFSKGHGRLHALTEGDKKDLETLRSIKEKKIPLSSFDYDGVRHVIGDCEALIRKVQETIDTRNRLQQDLDKTAFLYFLHHDRMDKARLLAAYRQLRRLHTRYEEYVTVVNRLMERIRPLYTRNISLTQVNQILTHLKSVEESRLKKAYRQLLDECLIDPPDAVNDFLATDYPYFLDGSFRKEQLDQLTTLAIQTAEQLNRRRFDAYKAVLELQAGCLLP